jgi:hypothetical protein
VEVTPDIGRIRERARELSKSLLGAQFRAEVAGYIAVGEAPFWARGMARVLDVPENKVAAELSRFAEAGLLVAMDVAQWDRRKLYERAARETRYWDAALDLIERAAGDHALETGIAPRRAVEAYLAETHPTVAERVDKEPSA